MNKDTTPPPELAHEEPSVRTEADTGTPPRKLNCDEGHEPCNCAGRLECHNCGKEL